MFFVRDADRVNRARRRFRKTIKAERIRPRIPPFAVRVKHQKSCAVNAASAGICNSAANGNSRRRRSLHDQRVIVRYRKITGVGRRDGKIINSALSS